MDSVEQTHVAALMPPQSPLARPIQALDRPYSGASAPRVSGEKRTVWWRALAFVPAVSLTVAIAAALTDWFAMDGFSLFEGAIVALIVFTFFWISLSLSTSLLGVFSLIWSRPKKQVQGPVQPLDVALLMPVYNEVPADVFGNAAAMLTALNARKTTHHYALFILSDTRCDTTAELELRAFHALRASAPAGINVYYRRRADNIDRKVGNLADWVERWGGAFEAMLVLDADSLMSGDAIDELSDALSADPCAGLIQSFPTLFGARSVFARMQQFSNRVYGAALAEGLAKWTDREGNYWGHNAIIRSTAFAACAGLPKVRAGLSRRKSPARLILSHDFIEAGLLRRAGWSVRFLPQIKGSYEEVPATLIDYVLRDRRWCQGNLQHLGLVHSRGFHAVSRFHLISGAMGYLMSPAWFVLLIVWALVGNGEDTNVVRYFAGFNPQVSWPTMSVGNSFAILGAMYGMLLAPKILGAFAIPRTGMAIRDLGGHFQFLTSLTTEIALSIAYAPILMIQQSIAVMRTTLGWRETWVPQNRRGGTYSFLTMLKFHIVETAIGILLIAGMSQGIVTLWLIPIALSLAFAVPLSALSGVKLDSRRWSANQLGTPEIINAPSIIKDAMAERKRFASYLDSTDKVAAE
ncbi:membrane glycosyltransferase [Cognatiyoonia koreensis]|uniref:Glucans biosynthesis glucosyltransferase H n=1 Tax=Cognatiyoonia koreensis TaxID=364200 RepID=A0A1I0RM17_9RHOB|nr:glucans biosynthesis glucosyltransferase MdoH [Cognatiyoonia koreensis]SEW42297.1 membrane glycosyltransferase [Cognatiyoonia koreensis]